MTPWKDHATFEEWETRASWFDSLDLSLSDDAGSYFVGEQASALSGEVRTVFCAGAWVATILLAMSAVDAQLREAELPKFKGNTKQLLEVLGVNPELQVLRQRRNTLVHVDRDAASVTVDDMWFKQVELEQEARSAVALMFDVLFMSPWV